MSVPGPAGVRRARRASVVFAAAGLALAQLAGCSACVKDDAAPSDPGAGSAAPAPSAAGRRPIDLRAADKRFSQFSAHDAQADASAGASADASAD